MVDLKEQKIELETISKIQEEVLLNIGDRNAAEKKLLRKIDMRLMPMMMFICKSYASSPVIYLILMEEKMCSTTWIGTTSQPQDWGL